MGDICTDNRFELIEKYKKELIESTNIETSQDEMRVLDSLLFRFWQMGWLDRLESPECKTGNRMNDPITNADRIRTMTDEELAETFDKWITNCDCNFTPCVEYCDMFDGKTCKERWLGWLKKAVEI